MRIGVAYVAAPASRTHSARSGSVVMLVMDVSTSMNATDVPPNRLKASQEAAEARKKNKRGGK